MSYPTISNRHQFLTALDLTETTDPKTILVIWCHAPWCGESKQVAPEIDKLQRHFDVEKNARVLWYRLNIEEATDVSDEYGISDTPTFMVFKNADILPEVKVMGVAAERLKREIEKHLNS